MAANSLSGKRVVVIGGASGIGFAVAKAALEEGARIVVASSQSANVEAAAARLGEGTVGSAVDVTDEAAVAAFFEGLGAFDHLVFTAGDWAGGFGSPLAQFDLAAAKTTLGVRFWGAIIAVKHACGAIAKDGSITLTDGMLAHRPMKGAALATAMSGALEHLTRALAVELAPVRVNAVCPGLVLTDRNRAMPDAMVKRFTDGQPLARAAEPAEVAQAYIYAMRAGYTTGQVLMVDGGRWVV